MEQKRKKKLGWFGHLKENVFELNHLRLKETNQGLISFSIIAFLSYIQFLKFIFHPTFISSWNLKGNESLLADLTTLFEFRVLLKNLSWTGHAIIFWTIILLIILIIFLFSFLIYKLHKKCDPSRWTLEILNLILRFLPLIYLPILEVLISMWECEGDGGKQVQRQHNDIECYTLIHCVYLLVSVLGLITIIPFTIMTTLLFFQSYKNNDVSARTDSYPYVAIIIIYTIIQFIWSLNNEGDNEIVLAFFLIIPWLMLFIFRFGLYLFYNTGATKIFNISLSLHLWACVSLILVCIFESRGSLSHFIIGVIVTIFTVSILNTNKLDILTDPFFEANINPKVPLKIFSILETVLLNPKENRRNKQLACSYIGNHERYCKTSDNCSLLKNRKKVRKNINRHQHTNFDINAIWSLIDSPDVLLYHIRALFRTLANMYPTNIGVRLAAINFVIYSMKNLELGIEVVTNLELEHLNIEESSVLHHLKRTLDEKLFKSRKGVNVDLSTYLRYDEYLRQLKSLIKLSAHDHQQLWTILQDEEPDTNEIKHIGYKIEKIDLKIAEIYEILMRITPGSHKINNLYADYVLEVLNDQYYAKQLNEKCKEMSSLNNGIYLNLTSFEEYSKAGDACFSLTYENDSPGYIKECNVAMGKLWGLERKDIIGLEIEHILPKIYANLLVCILEYHANKSGGKKETYPLFGKSRAGYAFPFSLTIMENPSFANKFAFTFLVTQDKKFFMKASAVLLTDTNFDIKEISSSCISILGFSKNKIHSYEQFNVSMIFPKFDTLKNELMTTREGVKIQYVHPSANNESKDAKKTYSALRASLSLTKPTTTLRTLSQKHSSIKELNVLHQMGIQQMFMIGYLTKIEACSISVGYILNISDIQHKTITDAPIQDKANSFQVNFYEEINKYVLEAEGDSMYTMDIMNKLHRMDRLDRANKYRHSPARSHILGEIDFSQSKALSKLLKTEKGEGGDSEEESKTGEQDIYQIIEERGDYYSQLANKMKIVNKTIDVKKDFYLFNYVINQIDIQRIKEKPIYAEDIRTFAMINNELKEGGSGVNINQLEMLDEEIKDIKTRSHSKSIAINEDDTKANFLSNHNIYMKHDFMKVLSQKKYPKQLVILSFFLYLFWLGCLILAFYQNSFLSAKLNYIKESIDRCELTYQEDFYFMQLMYHVRTLQLIVLNKTTEYISMWDMNREDYYSYTQNKLIEYIHLTYKHNENRKTNFIEISDSSKIADYTSDINRYFQILKTDGTIAILNVTFFEGMGKILAAALEIATQPIEKLNPNDPYFFLILENGLNEFFFTFINLNKVIYNHLSDECEVNEISIATNNLAYIVSAISILMYPLAFCVLYVLHKQQIRIYVLFLDIPLRVVIQFHKKCETFIKSLEYSKVDQNEENNELEEAEDEDKNDDTDNLQDVLGALKFDEGGKRQYKRPKSVIRANFPIFTFLSVSFLIIILYFTITAINANYLWDRFGYIEKTFSQVGMVNPVFAGAVTFEREYMYNNSVRICTGKPQGCVEFENDFAFTFGGKIPEIYKKGIGFYDSNIEQDILDILNENICGYYDPFNNITRCETHNNGLFVEGYALILTHYIRQLRYVYYEYSRSVNDLTDAQKLLSKYYDDPVIHEMDYMSQYLINPLNTKLMELVAKEMSSKSDGLKQLLLSLIISLCIIILLLGITWKLICQISQNYYTRTSRMLALIPLKVIMNNKTLFQFVEKLCSGYTYK